MQNQQSKIYVHQSYFTLSELREEWNTTDEQLRYMLENQELPAYLRPALVVYTGDSAADLRSRQPIPIALTDLCRLLHERAVKLKTMSTTYPATYDDIVVRQIDRCMVEAKYPNLSTSGSQPLVLFSDNWTCFEYRGMRLTFGRTQGAALKYLYQKLREGTPLVGTKELLCVVGANCHHVNNLFRHKPLWRELIIFPERGYCQLNLPDGTKVQRHQPGLFDDLD